MISWMQLQIPKPRRELRLQAWPGLPKNTHEASSTLTIRYPAQNGLVWLCRVVYGLFELSAAASCPLRFRPGGYLLCWPSIIRGADSVASSRAGRRDYARNSVVWPLRWLPHHSRDDQTYMNGQTNRSAHYFTQTLHVLRLALSFSLPFLISGPASRSNASFSRKDLLGNC
jgi:hypothetical protein